MDTKSLKLLIISSRPPEHSAGLGLSIMKAFQENGHKIKFLTVNDYPDIGKDVLSVYKTPRIRKIKNKLNKFKPYKNLHDAFHRLKNKIKAREALPAQPQIISFDPLYYKEEENPVVPLDNLLKRIKGRYDGVITLFWQDMLNSSSIRAISEKVKCPVLILAVDMAPITGGCFYFGDCRNFSQQCMDCYLADTSDEKKRVHDNFVLKKENYSTSNCAFLGNTWMNNFAKQSGLFSKIYPIDILIDEKFFYPADKNLAKINLGINNPDSFVVMMRSSAEPRKGVKDLGMALEKFLDTLSPDKKNNFKILSIGDDFLENLSNNLKPYVINLGFVDAEKLRLCYQASDAFINPSYDDAGPSMVNQSLMCGTPVISYDTGVAMDLVIQGFTGFKSATRDWRGLSGNISELYHLDSTEKFIISKNCRDTAMKHNSTKVFVKRISQILKDL